MAGKRVMQEIYSLILGLRCKVWKKMEKASIMFQDSSINLKRPPGTRTHGLEHIKQEAISGTLTTRQPGHLMNGCFI